MLVHQQIIGHVGIAQQLFYHRVAAFFDIEAGRVTEFRGIEAKAGGPLGKVAEHIQLRQGLGSVLQGCQFCGYGFQYLVVQGFLPCQRAALGAQGLVFEFFQFRGDKAFCVFQGLAADVIHWRLPGLGAGNFDVVAVYPVITHFQRADPGTLALTSLNVQQELACVLADIAQFVQFFVKTFADNTAIPDNHRRVVDDGSFQQVR